MSLRNVLLTLVAIASCCCVCLVPEGKQVPPQGQQEQPVQELNHQRSK